MTKTVRIENADNSNFKVVVEVWDKSYDGTSPDIKVKEIELNYPTALATEYITSHRYFIVRENGNT